MRLPISPQLVSILLCFGTILASEPRSLLPADPAQAFAAFGFATVGDLAAASEVAVPGQSFTKAMRIVQQDRPAKDWHASLMTTLAEPMEAGEVLTFSCMVRATAGGKAGILLVHQLAREPWTAALYTRQSLVVDSTWRPIRLAWTLAEAMPAGVHRFGAFLGDWPGQTVEIGAFRLERHGRIEPLSLDGYTVCVPGR